jgi:uncharacterized protein (TIGR02145 family)
MDMKTKKTIWVYAFTLLGIFCFLAQSCKKNTSESANNIPVETVTDTDGNIYHTVAIGTQVWMKENLAVVHYRNGDPVKNITDNNLWVSADSGACCNYNNDTSVVKIYGRLYNWYAVNDSRKLCPAGWHIPTDNEWKQMEMFLGMTQEQADSTGNRGSSTGGKLKETGTTHWWVPNKGATNSTGFSALPGGYRTYAFMLQLSDGVWWTGTKVSSDQAVFRGLRYDFSDISRNYFHMDETTGMSVRCVKD